MKNEEDLMRCVACAWFDEQRYCRKLKATVHRLGTCSHFKVRLADHYVRNAWDEWKKKAERKVNAEKVKSGG